MTIAFYALGTLVVVLALYLLLRTPVREYLAMRGDRIVRCPENGESVAVRLDALHAALAAPAAPGRFRLESCTRWPERGDCGQECLAQIAAQPTDCLVRTQVTRWYTDKTCAFCGKALGLVDWTQHQPALWAPDGGTVEWRDIKPEKLPDVLATHRAICWDCHVAETFRRRRPDLVIDNPHAGQAESGGRAGTPGGRA